MGSGAAAEDWSQEPTAEFTRVPVVDVHKGNLATHLNQIKHDIAQSSFVAIDCVRKLYVNIPHLFQTQIIKKGQLKI